MGSKKRLTNQLSLVAYPTFSGSMGIFEASTVLTMTCSWESKGPTPPMPPVPGRVGLRAPLDSPWNMDHDSETCLRLTGGWWNFRVLERRKAFVIDAPSSFFPHQNTKRARDGGKGFFLGDDEGIMKWGHTYFFVGWIKQASKCCMVK